MSDIDIYFSDGFAAAQPEIRRGAAQWVFCPTPGGNFPTGNKVFRSLPTLGEHLSLGGTIKESIQVVDVGGCGQRYPHTMQEFNRLVGDSMHTREIRFNTLVRRFIISVEAFIRNIRRIPEHPWLLGAKGCLQDIPVFVVSAGPSLDINGPLLKECARKGLIFSMFSSAGAVGYHGVESDMVFCIEALGSDFLVRDMPGLRNAGLSTGTGGSNFNVPAPKYLFSPFGGGFTPFTRSVGGLPMNFGPSVATAALCAAERLGSRTLVMLGQDCAYGPAGRVYATGTGREDVVVSVSETEITRSDCQEQTARYVAHGLQLAEAPRPKQMVPGWYGEPVATTQDMIAFIRWFETFAVGHTDKRLVNATEGGAHIQGAEETPLRTVLSQLPDIDSRQWEKALVKCPRVSQERIDQAIHELRYGAKKLKDACRAAIVAGAARKPQAYAAVERVANSNPLIAELSNPEHALIGVADTTARKKGIDQIRSLAKASDRMLELLDEKP